MKAEFFTMADQWLAAAATGIYQGALVALVVWGVLRAVRKTNAATRHAVWFLTLLLVTVIFCVHLASRTSRATPGAQGQTAAALTAPAARLGEPMLEPTHFENSLAEGWSEADRSVEETGRVPELLGASPAPRAEPTVSESQSQAGSLLEVFLAAFSLSDPYIRAALFAYPEAPEPGWRERFGQTLTHPAAWEIKALPRFFSLALICAWLLLVALRVQLLVGRLRRVARWKTLGLVPSPELQRMFQKLCRRIGVSRKVELRISSEQTSAMLVGFFHPVILLPETATLAEAEPVLCHELAHLSRRDDWMNLLQQFLAAVLFAHPVVWWISRQLLLEREIACDDYVLQQGGRPRAYALLLANLASRLQRSVPSLAPGASLNKSQLQERIDMILNTHRNTSPRLTVRNLAWMTSAAALLSAALVCAAPRLVLAGNENPLTAPAAGFAGETPALPAVPAVPAEPAVPAAPGSGAEPVRPVAPTTPAPPAVPSLVAPAVPGLPRISGAREGNASLEERLERVEQMLEALLEQPGRSAYTPQFRLQGPEALARKSRTLLDANQLAKERAKQEATRAVEEARRRSREAEKAVRGQPGHFGPGSQEVIQKKLEVLQQQLERLAEEKEKLNQELERLQREQRRVLESDDGKAEPESDLKALPPGEQ